MPRKLLPSGYIPPWIKRSGTGSWDPGSKEIRSDKVTLQLMIDDWSDVSWALGLDTQRLPRHNMSCISFWLLFGTSQRSTRLLSHVKRRQITVPPKSTVVSMTSCNELATWSAAYRINTTKTLDIRSYVKSRVRLHPLVSENKVFWWLFMTPVGMSCQRSKCAACLHNPHAGSTRNKYWLHKWLGYHSLVPNLSISIGMCNNAAKGPYEGSN